MAESWRQAGSEILSRVKRTTHEEEGVPAGGGLRSGGSGRVQIAQGMDPGWGRDRVRGGRETLLLVCINFYIIQISYHITLHYIE